MFVRSGVPFPCRPVYLIHPLVSTHSHRDNVGWIVICWRDETPWVSLHPQFTLYATRPTRANQLEESEPVNSRRNQENDRGFKFINIIDTTLCCDPSLPVAVGGVFDGSGMTMVHFINSISLVDDTLLAYDDANVWNGVLSLPLVPPTHSRSRSGEIRFHPPTRTLLWTGQQL